MSVSFGWIAASYGNQMRFLSAVQLSLLSRTGTFVERSLQSLLTESFPNPGYRISVHGNRFRYLRVRHSLVGPQQRKRSLYLAG